MNEEVKVLDKPEENKTYSDTVEQVDVYDLFDAKADETILEPESRLVFADRILNLLTIERILPVTALLISIIALTFALGRTELTIGQGDLFIEDASVNQMLGNLLESDLSRRLSGEIEIREINIRVEIHCTADPENPDAPRSVSDINSEVDRVTAELLFFPQSSVADFAADVREVLDAIAEQSQQHGFVYDEIVFTARDMLTNITATASGRHSLDITVAQIAAITFYFGEIDVNPRDLDDV
jgi:hypothetical protein